MVVRDEGDVVARAASLADALDARGVRARLDDRVDTSFGRRATDWELKGVPVRVEVGPRDLAEGNVTLVRRDSKEKTAVSIDGAVARAVELLDEIQDALRAEAAARRDSMTTDVASIDDVEEVAKNGFARIPWSAVGVEGEQRLAGRGVTVRCLQREDGSLPTPDAEDGLVAYVARAY
jgi:prolyl-tRNA synthetase